MSNVDPNRRPSNAGRYLFLFLFGLALGAIGVVMLMRTWEGRKTWQDKWHGAAMQVMQAHMGTLGANLEQNRCNATDTLPHLKALRTIGDDLEPAFPDLRDDQRFVTAASNFRSKADALLASPPLNCPGVDAAMKQIGETCKGCHQDFRG